MEGQPNRIDPDKWRPLIMSFQQFYGLTLGKTAALRTRAIPEAMYKPPGWRPAV